MPAFSRPVFTHSDEISCHVKSSVDGHTGEGPKGGLSSTTRQVSLQEVVSSQTRVYWQPAERCRNGEAIQYWSHEGFTHLQSQQFRSSRVQDWPKECSENPFLKHTKCCVCRLLQRQHSNPQLRQVFLRHPQVILINLIVQKNQEQTTFHIKFNVDFSFFQLKY